MNIYYSNINKFNEEIEDFVIAKGKIEKPLIDSEKIEKKMSITEFIDYINLSDKVYCVANKEHSVIPFDIRQPSKNDLVIMYSSTCEDKYNDQFKKDLSKINFDLKSLNHISQLDILNGSIDLNTNNYFIINGEFYK